MNARARLWLLLMVGGAMGCGSSSSPGRANATSSPGLTITLGTPSTFATHSQFAAIGFAWGIPDGTMGAVASGGSYTFFGAAQGASAATSAGPACAGSPGVQGAFRITGTLDHFTGLPPSGCKAILAKGGAPSGWIFDRDYAGGGSVLPFQSGSVHGLLMAYHGEVHWRSSGTANGLCNGVPCFYGGIGLAVSLDDGGTFTPVGQIIQAYQPLSSYQGSSQNVGIGYGSMVLADGAGNWLAAPQPTPSNAYLYVFYEDYLKPGSGGSCANAACVALARARLDDLVAAVLAPSGSNPATIAALFRKYDESASDPWSQPATGGDPTENTPSGSFTPLFSDGNSFLPSVIWDSVASAYLMVHQRYSAGPQPTSFIIRSSTDLLHWSTPLATYAPTAGHEPFYPTFIGEGGDPLVGGAAPRLFFSTFPASFPSWATSELDSLPVQVELTR
jgi:hypothetical protein